MKLIKHFDFTTMTALNEEDWTIQVGEKWANNEQQQYVNKPENIQFNNGLILRATINDDGIIESARINTKNKFFYQYGRIDIIAKVPSGKGTWPALWMMSEESRFGHWPKSGEIDIMEHTGNKQNELFLCLHTEKYNHRRKEQYYSNFLIPNLTEDFHTFSLDWQPTYIQYLLDGKELVTYHKGEEGRDASWEGWPFDQPFYLLINLAIGGTFGGEVDKTMFPQEFIIKDIKIYQ